MAQRPFTEWLPLSSRIGIFFRQTYTPRPLVVQAMSRLTGGSDSEPYLVYKRPAEYAFELPVSKKWVWVPSQDTQPPPGYVVAEVLNDSNINAIKVRVKDSSDVCITLPKTCASVTLCSHTDPLERRRLLLPKTFILWIQWKMTVWTTAPCWAIWARPRFYTISNCVTMPT